MRPPAPSKPVGRGVGPGDRVLNDELATARFERTRDSDRPLDEQIRQIELLPLICRKLAVLPLCVTAKTHLNWTVVLFAWHPNARD
jgi:hypothetical protein